MSGGSSLKGSAEPAAAQAFNDPKEKRENAYPKRHVGSV